MKTVRIYKAQPMNEPIESLTIVLDESIPEHPDATLATVHRDFERDAEALAAALCGALPGGTVDALTVELLRRKATSLVVLRDEPQRDERKDG